MAQRLFVATLFIVAGEVTPLRFCYLLDKERRLTLRTFRVDRFIPRDEVTFRIVTTTVKDFPALTASLTDIAFTIGLRAIDADVDGLCVFAFGISCTREEFRTGATGFNHHWAATFIACFIGRFLFGRWFFLLR